MKNPQRLYDICVWMAVSDSVSVKKFRKKEFRSLPNNVLFDFYYTMYLEKRLCLLAVEFSKLKVFSRMLLIKHQRVKLLRSFHALTEHGSNVAEELIQEYSQYLTNDGTVDVNHIDLGLKIGGFFNEGGLYHHSIKILSITDELCCKLQHESAGLMLKKRLECYHKKLYAETCYCEFKTAKETYEKSMEVITLLKEIGEKPNFAGLYSNFSNLFFHKSEYDESFSWAKRALLLLTDQTPTRIVLDVLRLASRACVVKRKFDPAGLLIRQAVNIASSIYDIDGHPHFSDILLDYGFYLFNVDSIQESVDVYRRALQIRKDVFERSNIHVALAYEDLAYALYVNEYSSGRFYAARENAERAIRLMERILPPDHLMLSSAKRVKALILEEIALDMREDNDSQLRNKYLSEAEELHRAALALSHKAFGEKNVQTAKHYGNLGRLYQSMKQYGEAENMHLRAIAIKEELLGSEDYEVGLSIGHLASLYNYHMKRHHDAEKLYMRSIEINLNLFGETYSGFEYDYRGLINVYSKLGDQMNIMLYTSKMREWSRLREDMKPTVRCEEILPLDQVIATFEKMTT